MPTLQFKGKNIIWNHHFSVPYHALEEVEKLHYHPADGEGNLIIEGDNLLALKALLPQYTGKIKCIYIDPPYNTGNENWVYNDNVNNPMIREWLGKEVGKDDLTRHDKWLCMMVPRLKLMRDLLTRDGVVFISIDDNEQHNIRQLMDEIFGEENFVACLPTIMNLKGNNDEYW
jgi:adenine-specific DNA-methyltransferase